MSQVRKRILIIEDQIEDREALSAFLGKNYEVYALSSLKKAQDALREGPRFDAAITDIRLDDADPMNRDGLLLLENIRTSYPKMPVLVMTAFGVSQVLTGNRGARLDAYALGAFEVLSKPLDFNALASSLSLALDRQRIQWRQKTIGRLTDTIPPIVVFIVLLALWEFLCRWLHVKEYLIPAPTRIGQAIAENYRSLLTDTGLTIIEAALGFLMANVMSLVAAIGFSHSKWLGKSIYPYMIALKSIPVVAIAPLLVLWFGYGIMGKIVMAAIISFFPLVVNATVGLKSADPEALELMNSLSASKSQILFRLRFPTALPYIFSALKISSALAVVGAIVGEMTGAKRGIGFVILISSYNIDTPMLFAAITAASLSGILFFAALAWVEHIFSARMTVT